ncbi:MAG: PEP-CTERM sorting domain-containing protein [Myxococcota bacterium]
MTTGRRRAVGPSRIASATRAVLARLGSAGWLACVVLLVPGIASAVILEYRGPNFMEITGSAVGVLDFDDSITARFTFAEFPSQGLLVAEDVESFRISTGPFVYTDQTPDLELEFFMFIIQGSGLPTGRQVIQWDISIQEAFGPPLSGRRGFVLESLGNRLRGRGVFGESGPTPGTARYQFSGFEPWSVVPEPSAFGLLALGLATFAGARRRVR